MAARRPKGPKGRKAPRRSAKAKKPARRAPAKKTARKRAPAKRPAAAARKRPVAKKSKRPVAKKSKRPVAKKSKRPVAKKKAAASSGRRTTPKRSAARARPSRDRLAAGVPVEVGVVTHWFPRVSAAVVRLSHPIHRGDTIHVRGQHSDFVQQVESLALEGETVSEGLPAQEVGLRLETRARPGDRVYRVSW